MAAPVGQQRGCSQASWLPLIVNVVAYLALNSSLNLLNKYALGTYGFRFPFFLTASHMAFCFLALLPREAWRPAAECRDLLRRQWKGLLGIGAFLAAGISLNNVSLMDISLSLNQVIRSSIPVVTCVLAILVERKVPTRLEAASLAVLSTGVMIAVWEGTVAGQPLGILFCALSTICSGLMVTFSGKLLSGHINVLSLAFYTAPVSLLCLAPFFLAYELPRFREYYAGHQQAVVVIVAISSVNALAYNICHYMLIKRISGVATTVIGEVKIVGLMILSALLLGESKHFTLKMSIGCGFALAGFFMYGHAKAAAYRAAPQQQQQQQQEEEAGLDEEAPLLKLAPDKEAAVAAKAQASAELVPLRPAGGGGEEPWLIGTGGAR